MKFARLSVSLLCVLSFAACQNLTPGQKQAAVKVAGVLGGLSQFVADTAVKVVIARADGPEDATKKADLLDSAASYLRSIEGATAGVLTPDQIAAGLTSFTDPSKVHWNELAQNIATEIVTTPAPPDAALEQAASSLNQVAATTRATAAVATNP